MKTAATESSAAADILIFITEEDFAPFHLMPSYLISSYSMPFYLTSHYLTSS